MSTKSKSAFWLQHIENCRRGSLNQKQYCRKHSIALSTFCYWKRKLITPQQKEEVRFYPLTVQPAKRRQPTALPAGLSLYFSKDDLRVELAEDFSVPALKQLLGVLQQS